MAKLNLKAGWHSAEPISGLGDSGARWWGVFILVATVSALFFGAFIGVFPSAATRILPFLLALLFLVVGLASSPTHTLSQRWFILGLVAYLTFLVLWPRYVFFKFGGLPSLSPLKLGLPLLIVMWLFALSLGYQFRVRLRKHIASAVPLTVLVLCMAFWRVVTAASSEEPVFSLIAVAVELSGYYAFFLICLTFIRDERDCRRIVQVLFYLGIAVLILTLYESKIHRIPFVNLVPVTPEFSSYLSEVLTDKTRLGTYRAQGTFEHPLLLAEFLLFYLGLATYLLVASKTQVWLRLLACASVGFALVGIYLTGSRAGLLIGAVELLMLIYLVSFWRAASTTKVVSIWIGFGLAVALIVLIPAVGTVMDLVQGHGIEAASTSARIQMINRGIPLVMQEPIFGHGVNLAAFVLGFVGGGVLTIDNYYLSLALDSGIPALLLYVALGIAAVVTGLKHWVKAKDDGGLLAAVLVAWVIADAVFKAILSVPHNQPFYYLSLGLLVVLRATTRPQPSPATRS